MLFRSVKKYFANAELSNLPAGQTSMATAGVGPGVLVVEQPTVTADGEMNQASAFVEPTAGGRSYGVWLASAAWAAVAACPALVTVAPTSQGF